MVHEEMTEQISHIRQVLRTMAETNQGQNALIRKMAHKLMVQEIAFGNLLCHFLPDCTPTIVDVFLEASETHVDTQLKEKIDGTQ